MQLIKIHAIMEAPIHTETLRFPKSHLLSFTPHIVKSAISPKFQPILGRCGKAIAELSLGLSLNHRSFRANTHPLFFRSVAYFLSDKRQQQ